METHSRRNILTFTKMFSMLQFCLRLVMFVIRLILSHFIFDEKESKISPSDFTSNPSSCLLAFNRF